MTTRHLATLALGAMLLAGCGAEQAATADEHYPPTTIVTTPIEIYLHGQGDTYAVASQCDLHGHRIFASRHPERPTVIDDPSCPGAATR